MKTLHFIFSLQFSNEMVNEVTYSSASVMLSYRNSSGIRRNSFKSDLFRGFLSSVVRRRIRFKVNILMRKTNYNDASKICLYVF